MQIEGLILAGGQSRRMGGRHKGSLSYENETFAQRLVRELKRGCSCVRISYGEEIREEYQGCQILLDLYPGCGPMGGLHAGLRACRSEWMAAAACDMPLLKMELFWYLEDRLIQGERENPGYDGAVLVSGGRMHPLAAIYRTGMLEPLEEHLKKGDYSIKNALKCRKILYADITGNRRFEQMLQNINTIQEYERLAKDGRTDITA